MNINWKTKEDQSYHGYDENGNYFEQPANQETARCTLPSGIKGQGWTPREAYECALINADHAKPLGMKAKDLIKALANLDPEAHVVINIKQSNKRYGFQLPIEYGSKVMDETDRMKDKMKETYTHYRNSWVNNNYGGSITVHLPDGAYVVGLPEDMKPV